MRGVIVFAVLVLTCLSAVAAEPTIVLLPDGTAWFAAGDGSPTILIKNIIRAPGAPPNGPTPNPQPNPPSDSKVREKVTELAKKVDDPSGATIMAKAYELLGEHIASGKVPSDPDSVDKAITAVADETIDMIPGRHADEWEDVHDDIMGLLGQKVIRAGGKLTSQEWASFFRDVSGGLTDAAEGNAIPPFLEPLIAALIKVLISVLERMFGG